MSTTAICEIAPGSAARLPQLTIREVKTSAVEVPMTYPLGAAACDYVMPDAARIGGVTGWIQAAGIAAGHRIEMSSHLLPEISAHLLAATPTCHYLEYVDWADAILEEPLQIVDGFARVPDRPGIGLTWRPEAVKSFAADRS